MGAGVQMPSGLLPAGCWRRPPTLGPGRELTAVNHVARVQIFYAARDVQQAEHHDGLRGGMEPPG